MSQVCSLGASRASQQCSESSRALLLQAQFEVPTCPLLAQSCVGHAALESSGQAQTESQMSTREVKGERAIER